MTVQDLYLSFKLAKCHRCINFSMNIDLQTGGNCPGQSLSLMVTRARWLLQISDVQHQHLRPCYLATLHWLPLSMRADVLPAG